MKDELLQQIEALHLRMADMLALSREDREQLMNRTYDIAEELEVSLYGNVSDAFETYDAMAKSIAAQIEGGADAPY